MKRMPQAILVLCFASLFVGALAVSPSFAQNAAPTPKEAAEAGFRHFLDAIPADALAHFNFADGEEVKNATLGDGLRVYTIHPASILSYDQQSSINEMLVPTSMWLFPIVSKGLNRTLLTVDVVDGEYKAVSIGASGLAVELAEMCKKWPSDSGYVLTFIRVYQATADFMLLSGAAPTGIVPFQSGRIALQADRNAPAASQTVYAPAEVISSLQEPVRDNLDKNGH